MKIILKEYYLLIDCRFIIFIYIKLVALRHIGAKALTLLINLLTFHPRGYFTQQE